MSDPKGRVQFDALYGQVQALFATGVFRPGDRISVKDLAGLIAASTTPAREILSRLVGRDIVEEHRSEGYYLRSLDGRQIADLYRLHAECVDIALRDEAVTANSAMLRCEGDSWNLFDLLVEATGNSILLDTHRYLDARLALLRRCEQRLFDDLVVETARLRACLTSDDRSAGRKMAQAFHQRRVASARQLAFCLIRR